jgi:hypothetical protein
LGCALSIEKCGISITFVLILKVKLHVIGGKKEKKKFINGGMSRVAEESRIWAGQLCV